MKKLITIPILLLALLLIPVTTDAASGVQIVSKTGDGVWTDDTWQVEIYPGETKSTTINLHNSASNSLDVEVSIHPDSLDDGNLIFELNNSNFTMSGGSYTNVTLTVKANGSTTPGTYNATLEIKSEVPPPSPGPGGGGGGGGAYYLDIDILGKITRVRISYATSRTLESVVVPDFNNTNFLEIDYGTTVICPEIGEAPEALMMRVAKESPPVPDGSALIGSAYNFTGNYGYNMLKYCSGVTFDQNVTIVLDYDPNELPESTVSLAVAYYDAEQGIWVSMPPDIGRVAEVGKATGLMNHFSTVAIIAELGPAPAPASFAGSALNIKQSPLLWKNIFVGVTGGDVTITANVVNNGGEEGTYIAELKLNGETIDTKEVTLGPGQSQQVRFTLSGIDYGQYQVEVAGLSGEFTVSRSIDWLSIFGIIVAIGLITWAVIWGRRRWKKPAQPAQSE